MPTYFHPSFYVFLLQPLKIYESDDQNDDNDDDDVSDDESNNPYGHVPKPLANLLNDNRKMQEVENKMKKIIKYTVGSEESQTLLFEFFKREKVLYEDAAFCKTLFLIYLKHSGNQLLIKLLETASHKGRNGNLMALDEFKSIWYDYHLDIIILTILM